MYEIYEQLLQKHGVTNYKVHKDTGIAQSVLSAWKNGVSTPKQDKLKKIADYFGVSLDFLMTGKEDNTSESDFLMRDPHEKNIVMMYRNAGDLSEEEKNEFEKMFGSMLETYLTARGIKKK